jgi:hypothetical protein
MDGAGEDLLAGAGFALDQHRHIRARHPAGKRDGVAGRRADSDKVFK